MGFACGGLHNTVVVLVHGSVRLHGVCGAEGYWSLLRQSRNAECEHWESGPTYVYDCTKSRRATMLAELAAVDGKKFIFGYFDAKSASWMRVERSFLTAA